MDLNVIFNQYGQRDQADRREVSPPIEVESATWSAACDLDYLVKERQDRWGPGRVHTDITCGPELLIYMRPTSTDSREFRFRDLSVAPATAYDLLDCPRR
jgi:hypothetical protein